MLFIIQHACCNYRNYFIKADSGTEAAEIFAIKLPTKWVFRDRAKPSVDASLF